MAEQVNKPKVREVTVMGTFEVPADEGLTDARLTDILQKVFDAGVEAARAFENDPDAKDILSIKDDIWLEVGPPPSVYVEVAGGNVNDIYANREGVTAKVMDHDNAEAEAEDEQGGARQACAWLDEHRDDLHNIY